MADKLFVVDCAVAVMARSKPHALEIVESTLYLAREVQNVDSRARKPEPVRVDAGGKEKP